MSVDSSNLKRMLATPLGSVLRKQVRRHVQDTPELLLDIEQWLRPGSEGHLPGSLSSFRMARTLKALDTQTLHHALLRLHYKAMKQAPAPEWREYEYRGYSVRHDIRHRSQWNAFMKGYHQPGVAYWLTRYATSGSVALDIGANVGVFTLEIARALQGQGRIYAFEPNPEVYEVLMQTVRDNRLEHLVIPVSAALGTDDQTLPLSIPEDNNGAASLTPGGRPGRRVEVPVRAFMSWWEEAGQPTIDLIKIDVEGHEAAVIEGLVPYLETHHPVIVMEITPAKSDQAGILTTLADLGYRFRRILEEPPHAADLPDGPMVQMDILCEPAVLPRRRH